MSTELSSTAKHSTKGCDGSCRGANFAQEITMAFQPIVDLERQEIYAFEALVRGVDGRSAAEVLSCVDETNMFAFGQTCRVMAIQQAASLKMDVKLSINFIPNAVYEPQNCIRSTLTASEEFCFPKDRLIFEVLEGERVTSREHLASIFSTYSSFGFMTALDDFGEGYSGLNHLCRLRPDIVKMDMALVRDIDRDDRKRSIMRAMVSLTKDLGVRLISEGVETEDEILALRELGVELFQGYVLARPTIGELPSPRMSF